MSSGETATATAEVSTDPGATAEPSLFPASGGTGPIPSPASRALFSSDSASGSGEFGRAAEARFLAELLAHKRADTPFCLALFGAAGSGKSFFLNRILDAAAQLSGGATRLGGTSPFLAGLQIARVDASGTTDPAATLAAGVLEALAASHPKLAAEARHAGDNPVLAARDMSESLNDARRRLDTERQTLEAIRAREARLSETVLFDSAGSRVDTYARTNRSRLERMLRGFGFTSADPVATYKDLVREAAESGGPLARAAISLRALWAYQGQTRLLVYAILLALVAWSAAALQANQPSWIDAIRAMGDKAVPVADWAQSHVQWLRPIRTAATALAVLALIWNILRAARFLQPIFRGVSLLRLDVDARRRDINGMLAHQTRRVDTLAAEVESAAKLAEEADRRVAAHHAAGLATLPVAGGAKLPFAEADRHPAMAVFASLGAAIEGSAQSAGDPGEAGARAPSRIVVAIDGLDHLTGERAADVVSTARHLLGRGFAVVIAADRNHLATGFSDTDQASASAQLSRCVQLAYDLGASGGTDAARSSFAMRLIDGAATSPGHDDRVDASRSALDEPWRSGEAETVAALAPFAGQSPRAVKQFVNTYRVARADPNLRDAEPPVFTALALALALAGHGYPDELAALERASLGESPEDGTVLREALAAARGPSGAPVELAQAQRALEIARRYTARG